MKTALISILLLILFSENSRSNSILQTQGAKRVLIINSYRESIDWSRTWTDGISQQLKQQHPSIEIHTNTLNSDVSTTLTRLALQMRSALWMLSSTENTNLSENLSSSSIFQTETTPDILVIIGNEALLCILTYGHALQNWKNIPIILCGVNEKLTEDHWYPERHSDFNKVVPIENKRKQSYSFSIEKLTNKDNFLKELGDYKITNRNGKDTAHWTINLNITGVKTRFNIDKNIEMIRQLHPEMKELIFIDNQYYTSSNVWHNLQKIKDSLLTDVEISRTNINTINTDSIYNEILVPHPGRVYLTNSWKIEGTYSRRFESQMDSLFTNQTSTPIYSLTQQKMDGNYIIGGYYPDKEECIKKSIQLINRILQGEKASEIPFDTISTYSAVMNESALKRGDLFEKSQAINGAIYVNPPPPFFEQHKKPILYTLISMIILIGFIYNMVRHKRFCKLMLDESNRFKRLYDKIQTVYKYAEIDFAFYDKRGRCLIKVIDGQRNPENAPKDSLLTDNILHNNPFSDIQIEKLHNTNNIIHTEVQSGENTYEMIIKSINLKQHQHHYMVVIVDLTQMIRARHEKELFEQMFNYVSDFSQLGIALYDLETHKMSATDYWYKNINEPLVRGFIPSYCSVIDTDRELLQNHFKSIVSNKSEDNFSKDIRIIDSENSPHWIRENIFVRTIASRKQIIEINLNIDNQKEDENRLRKANELADRSNQETISFVENISHEVRTPLNSIVGFSSIFTSLEDEEKLEFANIIKLNKQLLNNQIDNIIHLSMIDSGKVEFKKEPINLNSILEKTKESTKDHINNTTTIVTINNLNKPILSDAYYIQLMIFNLASNAVKFTEAGTIVIGCRPTSEPDYIELYVSDTGCGIDKSNYETIFNRFYKLDRYKQGTGLGLSLCKSIVDHMDGTITIDSAIGKGTTFSVRLKA